MEHNRKRRSSILKKPSINNEDTTVEMPTRINRRISFSGKKSVKEFRAGEEEATIWGTSYEESAEVLQANSADRGAVNANDKRIVLRNRRVIVEPKQTKQRRSKKKVSVAEHDKENVFVVESKADTAVESPSKVELLTQSELAVENRHFDDKISQTMSEPLERINVWSSTFDYINFSGSINKSMTIEQSVDVTLCENELHMFKFRVPVTDVRPNLNSSSIRDGSSPNIFSGSILMSEEDKDMIKIMRSKRPAICLSVTGAQMTELEAKEIEEKKRKDENKRQTDDLTLETNQSANISQICVDQRKTISTVANMEMDDKQRILSASLNENENMDISHAELAEAKSLKRKTITKVETVDFESGRRMERRTICHPIAMDASSVDFHSPLRKKPMHNATSNPMDITKAIENSITEGELKTIGRQTIHFKSVPIDDSLSCNSDEINIQPPTNESMEQSLAVPSTLRQTVYFDHNQLMEESNSMDAPGQFNAVVIDHDVSMDLSTCEPKALEQRTSNQKQTVGMDHVPKALKVLHQTIIVNEDIVKDAQVKPILVSKQHQSIYNPTDIDEDFSCSKKSSKAHASRPKQFSYAEIVKSTPDNHKKRESIYTVKDIVEDSPKPSRPIQIHKCDVLSRRTIYPSANIVEDVPQQVQPSKAGMKSRESIYTVADILEDSPKPARPIHIPKCDVLSRRTIYPSADIVEDVPQQVQPSKAAMKSRESIYTVADILEDSPKATHRSVQAPKSNVSNHQTIYSAAIVDEDVPQRVQPSKAAMKSRESIYTVADILEDSPKPARPIHIPKCDVLSRRTIYPSADIVEDVPQRVQPSKAAMKSRESIYTVADILEDSPKATHRSVQAPKSNVSNHQTIYSAAKIDEDVPQQVQPSKAGMKSRESIYTVADILEDSPKATHRSVQAPKSNVSNHQTIYSAANIDEDVPQRVQPSKAAMKSRESIYTVADIVEDSPKPARPIHIPKCDVLSRRTIYPSADIVEDVPQQVQPSKAAMKSRESIYTVADILEDSPKATHRSVQAPKSNVSNHQTIYSTANIDEDVPQRVQPSKAAMKSRESIYTVADIVEGSPKATQGSTQTFQSHVHKHQSIYSSADIEEDVQPSDFASISILENSTQPIVSNFNELQRRSNHMAFDIMEDSLIETRPSDVIKNPRNSSTKDRHTIYAFDDILEVSPKQSNVKERQSIYTVSNMVRDSPSKTKSGETVESKGLSFQQSQAEDVMDDSRKSTDFAKRQSINTPFDMIEDSRKTAKVVEKPQPTKMTAPKVIVTHMNLKQSVSGDNAVLRILKNQLAKKKHQTEVQVNDSTMDMSSLEDLPTATDKMNFCQLNEDLLKGKTRAFTEERHQKMSLFDRLEKRSEEDAIKFDSFMDQDNARGCVKQTAKNSMKDYTMELSMKKPLGNQQRRESEFNIDFSFTKSAFQHDAVTEEQSRRQTIHLHKDIDLDASTNVAKDESMEVSMVGEQKNSDLMHVPNSSVYDADSVVKQKTRQTIHFSQDNDLEESRTYAVQEQTSHALTNPSRLENVSVNPPSMHLSRLSDKSRVQSKQDEDDTMDLSPIGCSKSQTQTRKEDTMLGNKSYKSPTISVQHEMDLDISAVQAAPRVSRLRKPSMHFNCDLELELQSVKPDLPETSQRRTVYLNQNLDMTSENEKQPSPMRTSIKPPNTRLGFDIENPAHTAIRNRRTLHLNDDIEFDEEDAARQIRISDETKRNTAENAQRIPQFEQTQLDSKLKRQTIHFNQDVEVDDIAQQHTSSKCLSQNVHLNDDNQYDQQEASQKCDLKAVKAPSRRTCHFNDDVEVDEEVHVQESKLKRQTIYFPKDNELEESVIQAEGAKMLPKPRRVTVFDNQPIQMEEEPSNNILQRKSSFSRTLNFNEIDLATSKNWRKSVVDMDVSAEEEMPVKPNDDSPLYNFNSKSKGHETTLDIDRSLAEYLKAEAAAASALHRIGTPDISVDEENCKPEIFDQQAQSRRQTTSETVNMSGMQPLQRGKEHVTILMDELQSAVNRTNIVEDVQAKAVDPKDAIKESHGDLENTSIFELKEKQADRVGHKIFGGLEKFLRPNTVQPTDMKNRSEKLLKTSEDGENSMEFSMLSEEPVKFSQSKVSLSRKTIHFTNENAVDESFFDENLSKRGTPKKENNRQTIYFTENKNHPISDMDVTVSSPKTTPRSQRNQGMTEMIFKNNLSLSLQPSTFESKRSTTYFDDGGQHDLMDITTANESDAECLTPTKNQLSKSRIPQLIGSAKKLQSIKKSMEYIQQELPQVLRRENATKNVKDIPQTEQLHHESFETIDIPRGLITYEHERQLQESIDTVEIPRRATTFQKNDTINHCPNETINMSQKSFFKFDDAPITISDVSTYFSQKQLSVSKPPSIEPYSPNTTEALCTLDVNRIVLDDELPKSSDSEDTTHQLAKFKKRYVELTCDSIRLSGLMDDIDKTRLSLVNTLDEEPSELVPSIHLVQIPMESPAAEEEEPLKPIASVCRKCKRHRLSVTQNDTTIGSFMLEPEPEYKINFEALHDLAKKPNIVEVANVWRQRMRESDSFNVSEASRSAAWDDEDEQTVEEFRAALDQRRLLNAQERKPKTFQKSISFVHSVRKQMESTKSNWILNDLLLGSNILRFSHTRMQTFAIFISFTPKDPQGTEVNFNEIKIAQNAFYTRQWSPFDSALHYQLLVELPFDLRKLCPTSENLFQFLEHVEEVIQDVLKTGKDMLYLVLTSPATLIRESSGCIYIKKCARTKTAQYDLRRTEFLIEVRNMKKLSYKSIVMPPLYEFDEQIQELPVGEEFLRVFLANPMEYMKTS